MSTFFTDSAAKQLASCTKQRMDAGFAECQKGQLISEEPYMSHLNVQILSKAAPNPGGFGAGTPRIDRQLKVLHRKGEHNRDEFGADLAIKVEFASSPAKIKVALFQIKLSRSSWLSLDLAQLHDLATEQLADKRGFVVFVDSKTGAVKVVSAADLWKAVPAKQKQKVTAAIAKGKRSKAKHKVDVSSFTPVDQWLTTWFKCEVGGELSSEDSDEVKLFDDAAFGEPSDANASDKGSGRLGKLLVGEILEVNVRSERSWT